MDGCFGGRALATARDGRVSAWAAAWASGVGMSPYPQHQGDVARARGLRLALTVRLYCPHYPVSAVLDTVVRQTMVWKARVSGRPGVCGRVWGRLEDGGGWHKGVGGG